MSSADAALALALASELASELVLAGAAVDVNALTPLQALNLLEELQQELKEKS